MLNTFHFLNSSLLAKLEVGEHYYWKIGGLSASRAGFYHLLGCLRPADWCRLLGFAQRRAHSVSGLQNLMEYALDFIRDLAKDQIGEKEYRPWVPFVGTLFLFIFVCNWAGALSSLEANSYSLHGELTAPTNDINTTVALALSYLPCLLLRGLSKSAALATSSSLHRAHTDSATDQHP